MPSAFGGLGCNPRYKKVKSLWTNYGQVVRIESSRPFRCRATRVSVASVVKKNYQIGDLFVGRIDLPRFYFMR